MLNDAQILAGVPDYISIGNLLKANPVVEGGRRFVYFEASNEGLDQQNEVIAAQALAESADYFLKYGNIDIDHFTLLGPKAGIPDYSLYEIGRPVEVRQAGDQTFVKAEIYAGEGPAADRANQFWSSLTEIDPPARWYPSVGGAVLAKAMVIDPETKDRRAVVTKVRWTNIGVSKTPVNQHVAKASTMPVGVFAKSLGGFVLKALDASGAGTDSAALTGGAALGMQSLDGSPRNYFDFRNRLADALRGGKAGQNPGAQRLIDYAAGNFGMPLHEAAEWVERFMRDLKTGLKKRRRNTDD